jgi:hypothetical protein
MVEISFLSHGMIWKLRDLKNEIMTISPIEGI